MATQVELHEGAVALRVPATGKTRGPAKRTGGAFYNAAAKPSRDVSVLFVASARPRDALDGLAGSGVRGLRWNLEAGAQRVTLCDKNPQSVACAEANAQLNGARVTIVRRDLNGLLTESLWDHVDVDPFGSPAPFFDSAVRAVRRGGSLAVTATDAAALAGSSPRACIRRYGATPLRCDCKHEIALRILAGAVIRAAARHDRAAIPELAHADDYYYRAYFRMERGAGKADALLAKLAHALVCRSCGWRAMEQEPRKACACRAPLQVAGPLFAGPLWSQAVASEMLARVEKMPWEAKAVRKATDLLGRLAADADVPALPFELHTLTRALNVSPPPIDSVIGALREAGHAAVRAHTGDGSVKTDAPWDEVRETVRRAAAAHTPSR